MEKKKLFLLFLIIPIIAAIIVITIMSLAPKKQAAEIDKDDGLTPEDAPAWTDKTTSSDFTKFSVLNKETTKNSKVEEVINDQVISPVFAENNDAIFYFSSVSKKIVKYILSTKQKEDIIDLGNAGFGAAQYVAWAPDGKTGVFYASLGSYLLDLMGKTYTSLGGNLRSVAYSPDGTKIAYQLTNLYTNKSYICRANPDRTNEEKLVEIDNKDYEIPDFVIDWLPDGKNIVYAPLRSDFSAIVYFAVNVDDKKVRKMEEWGEVYDFTFSPDAAKILYTTISDDIIRVWRMNLDGANKKSLELENFLKCAWIDNVNVVCSASENIYNNAGRWANDIFVKINTDTLEKTPLTLPETALFDAEYPFLVADQNIYFKNLVDQKLYKFSYILP